MKKKAVALFSGGLDSMLAVRMMLDQGIDVMAVNFVIPFDNSTPKTAGGKHQAAKVAEEFGIPISVIYEGMDYMRMVEKPPHGYGRGMNPCIDCRIHMLRAVKGMMPMMEASFVVTGEVLGQRPMSQRRQQIALIERESGLEGLILRPLSAQNFPPTIPELAGIVDREKLLNISGRSRRMQIDLAKELGIADYPGPAGGCLLTDPVIASRLKDLFAHVPDYNLQDLQLIKFGRHFRIHSRLRIILGRNQEENDRIALLAAPGSTLFLPEDFRGPTALLLEGDDEADLTVGKIIARYCQDEKSTYLIKKQVIGGGESFFPVTDKYPAEQLDAFLLGRS